MDIEPRLARLEDAVPEIREAVARIESTLFSHDKHLFPQLVTKADLLNETSAIGLAVAHFRTDITRLEASMIKWFVGTAVVLSGGIGAIAFGLARTIS